MTAEQKEMLMIILKQNDAVLEMNWQLIQTLAPLPMMEDEDGSEQLRTLQ